MTAEMLFETEIDKQTPEFAWRSPGLLGWDDA
jgi:hypothetical protein